MDTANETFGDRGLELFNAGFNTLPIKPREKAPPITDWRRLDITADLVQDWASNGYAKYGVGIRCGKGCHGLDGDIYDADVARKVREWIEQNLSDGRQLAYRVGQDPKFLMPARIEGIEKKLVSDIYIDADGNRNQIEILADGQQYVAHGIHQGTGKPYEWFGGSLHEIGADGLLNIARDDVLMLFDFFDELAIEKGWQKVERKEKPSKPTYTAPDINSTRPGDIFNREKAPEFHEMIEKAGWQYVYSTNGNDFYRRPGKDDGHSASWNGNTFYVFTSSDPNFEGETGYDMFGVYTRLFHGGDAKAAAQALTEKGIVKPPAPEKNNLSAVNIADFLSLEFPPRENLLSPWLPSQGLALVYAARGIGKTHFALGVAYAIASGGNFLGWQAPAPEGVLYLDGEMPGRVMQERLGSIIISNDSEPQAPFILLTPDLQPEGMPRIDTEDGQQAIERILTDDIKLIIVDNISTLARAKENDADGWTPVQAWALKQRAQGRSVLFVHHSGKGGQQRGTSRREDVLDTVISLKRPVDYKADQGAVFEIHFEKARGIYGEDVKPLEAALTVEPDGTMNWLTRSVEAGTFDRVVALLNEGVKQNEIAMELGLHKSNVSRHVKKARAQGLVTG